MGDPNEVATQLKKEGASLPSIRPGKATAEFLRGAFVRMSILGSIFLSLATLVPNILISATDQSSLVNLDITSILILVSVATDFSIRLHAEMIIEKYQRMHY